MTGIAPRPHETLDRMTDHDRLTCRVFRKGEASKSPEKLADISEVLREPSTLVWFDVVDPDQEDLAVLEAEFDLHPLAIEDAVHAHERPKVEAYGRYWFLVVRGASMKSATEIVFHEVAIFAAEKFLVTVRHEPAFPLEEIQQRWNAHPERLRGGGGFLLYTILDTIVDGYFPIVDHFEDHVEALEQDLFHDTRRSSDVLREIFSMRKEGQQFRHAALPMRDILNPVIRGDLTLFPDEEIVYFRDVYDHAIRVIDQLDTLRDILSSALEIHLSVVANRQNEVAKQLTIIATIFLPLSFLVGFFGQNFDFLVSHISGAGPFWLLGIGSEVVVVTAMFALFKHRGWF